MENQIDVFNNKIVCITGSRRGVGKNLVEFFIQKGARVIGISRTIDDFRHDNYYSIQGDISNAEDMKKAFVEIKNKFGTVHILLNNAGISHSSQALFLTVEKASEMININFLGAFIVSKEAAKLMMKSKYGRIVNIGSICSTVEPIGASIYSATKAALHSLSNSLAKEFSSFNITSNTIALSPFPTDMLNTISQKDIDWYLNEQKIKRLATIDDITNVVEFFCSEKSAFITAQFIQLGGIST
jgi:3-oxoacyl-[acyl-carrier protein] reductase